MPTVDALDYLLKPEGTAVAPVCVAFGDDGFLRREAIASIRREVLTGEDDEFSSATFDGRRSELREVLDELATIAMFGSQRRLVVVEEADDFVSRFRSQLEDYVAAPRTKAVLVLDVTTWQKTTRLYKAVTSSGLQIECRTPTAARLPKWLASWARKRHDFKLELPAAELLVDLAGLETGILDQELAKLAAAVGPKGAAGPDLVESMTGSWRTRTAWEMLDAAADGNAREALRQLDRLLLAGEHPIGLLAQMSTTLRRFTSATRQIEHAESHGRRISLRDALAAAGVKPFVLGKAEPQLRQIGRQRGGSLLRQLLEADLDLKGQSQLPSRMVLERLIATLAQE